MDNLPVGSAHRTQSMIVGEKPCEFRIDLGLILAFMLHDLSRNDCVCLRNQCDCSNSLGIIQRIGNFPQPIEPGFNPFVILAQGSLRSPPALLDDRICSPASALAGH